MKTTNLTRIVLVSLVVLGLCGYSFAGQTIYVDDDADGANNGSSWADAYNYLQDALAACCSGDEIRVAQGIYKPDKGAGVTPGDREATFQLISDIAMKGGYAGFGQPDPNHRDIELYETILSGDMNGDDGPNFGNIQENSYHVVTSVGINATVILDGFTIRGGNADGPYSPERPNSIGAGMYNQSGSPTLANCTFKVNSAAAGWWCCGGGMYSESGSPTLTNCTFEQNSAGSAGAMCIEHGNPVLKGCTFVGNRADNGCGALNTGYDSPTIINSRFENNRSESYAGAIACHKRSPKFINCIVRGNSSNDSGGGIFISDSSPILTNCKFSGNTAGVFGGAVHCEETSSPIIRNCLISGNKAECNGGGISNTDGSDAIIENCTITDNIANGKGGGIYSPDRMTVINSILWGSYPDQITRNYRIVINYSDVEGGWSDVGNFDEDPCFVESGYWDANGTPQDANDDFWVDGDYHLLWDSPCINAGDPDYLFEPSDTDLDGGPRVINSRIDIGAYEFLREPQIIYVDADATGANDGSSWADAYSYLQNALAVAQSGNEIHVAQGIYKPTEDSDREISFIMVNHLVIKGGYAGCTEPNPGERDIQKYETILSGDLMGNDTPGLIPENLLTDLNRSDNSWTVILASGVNRSAVLDGCTVYGGQSDIKYTNEPTGNGGGIYMERGNPTLRNCTFRANAAADSGGGILNDAGLPQLLNCCFEGNYCGWSGGGLCNLWGSPTLQDCRFENNYAGTGAGLYNLTYYVLTLDRCTFNSNVTTYRGGGIMIYEYEGQTILNNCLLTGNQAPEGGAIGCDAEESGTLILNNCTVAENEAEKTGGGIFRRHRGLAVNNCIFWANADSTGYTETAQIHVPSPAPNYTCVQGWTGQWPGIGNIGSSPFFVDPINDDYHLLPDSSCIDAGDPNYIAGPNETDLDGRPRVIGGRIDMGAYEYGQLVSAEARVVPKTINLASKGNWITCYIRLPENYSVADIDPNSILLKDEIKPEQFSVDEQQQVATAKFSRQDVQSILDVGEVELTITCQLADGTVFEAMDTIRVTGKAGKN